MHPFTSSRILLLPLIMLLFSSTASAQTAIATVGIINEPPVMLNVSVLPALEGNVTSILWCTGVAEDRNGAADMTHFNATMVEVDDSGKAVGAFAYPALVESFVISETDVSVTAAFVVSTPEARYFCNMSVADGSNATASNTGFFSGVPSSCSNGVLDAGEENADCGGLCSPCAKGVLQINAPDEVTAGESAVVEVASEGKAVKSIVRAKLPDGRVIVRAANEKGRLNITFDSPGVWELTADAYGYKQASKNVQVSLPLYYYVIAGLAVILLLAIIYKTAKKRMKKEVSSSEASPNR